MRLSPRSTSPREKRSTRCRCLSPLLVLGSVAVLACLSGLSSNSSILPQPLQGPVSTGRRHARILLAAIPGMKFVPAEGTPAQSEEAKCKCEAAAESKPAATAAASLSGPDEATLRSQREALQTQITALEATVAQLAQDKAVLVRDKASALEDTVALRNQLADGESTLTEVKDQITKHASLRSLESKTDTVAVQRCGDDLKAAQAKAVAVQAQEGQLIAEKALLADSLREAKITLSASMEQMALLRNEVGSLRRQLSLVKEQQPAAASVDCLTSQVLLGSNPSSVETASRIEELAAVGGAKGGAVAPTTGYRCTATEEDMARYNNYVVGGDCPNDWFFVQRLIFKKNCFSLPRRRCRAITPAKPAEPLPSPQALFDQSALKDSNVRWDLHDCKSFECLNARKAGDCRLCFNMTLEEHRWKRPYRGTIPMAEVLAMKKGTIRIGLDAGGGTGSFAAHMANHGVTVLTTAFNVETVSGQYAGLPYHETIAARGLVPLHVPHQSRLPFFDGVLDVVHSVNSIKYIPLPQFEELIYEWDRVLRVGGIFWFEMFYAPVEDMPKYVQVIERVGYKKLYWQSQPKTDAAELPGKEHVYLNCVLEKQANPGKQALKGPSEEDMKDIFVSE